MSNKKLFIAHRGARKFITENTIDSVLLSYHYGATHAEVDVRKTKDNALVLFHDPITTRFNKKFSLISRTEVKSLEKIVLVNGGKLTTLNILFQEIKNRFGNLVVELKIKGIEKEVFNLIKKYNLYERVIIWSFQHQIIKTFDRLDGGKVKKAILLTLRPFSEKQILERALDCGADFVFPIFRNLDINFFNKNGIGLIKSYELSSDENKAKNFLKQGGAGIITSNMAMLRRLARDYY